MTRNRWKWLLALALGFALVQRPLQAAMIQDGSGTANLMTVDPNSKAARVGPVDTSGNSLVGHQPPKQSLAINHSEGVSYAIPGKTINSGALSSGSSKTMASLWHLSSSTKDVRLRGLRICTDSHTGTTGGTLSAELFHFGNATAPSGGGAVTPITLDPADGVAELSFQTAPVTAGANEDTNPLAVWRNQMGNLQSSASELYRDCIWLYQDVMTGLKPPRLRAATQEGWNLKLTELGLSSAETTVWTVTFYVTEE